MIVVVMVLSFFFEKLGVSEVLIENVVECGMELFGYFLVS